MDKESLLKQIKETELRERLKKVSQNNVAFVEQYPNDKRHWGQILKEEICECSRLDWKESRIAKLEKALKRVEKRERKRQIEEKSQRMGNLDRSMLKSLLKEILEDQKQAESLEAIDPIEALRRKRNEQI